MGDAAMPLTSAAFGRLSWNVRALLCEKLCRLALWVRPQTYIPGIALPLLEARDDIEGLQDDCDRLHGDKVRFFLALLKLRYRSDCSDAQRKIITEALGENEQTAERTDGCE